MFFPFTFFFTSESFLPCRQRCVAPRATFLSTCTTARITVFVTSRVTFTIVISVQPCDFFCTAHDTALAVGEAVACPSLLDDIYQNNIHIR